MWKDFLHIQDKFILIWAYKSYFKKSFNILDFYFYNLSIFYTCKFVKILQILLFLFCEEISDLTNSLYLWKGLRFWYYLLYSSIRSVNFLSKNMLVCWFICFENIILIKVTFLKIFMYFYFLKLFSLIIFSVDINLSLNIKYHIFNYQVQPLISLYLL